MHHRIAFCTASFPELVAGFCREGSPDRCSAQVWCSRRFSRLFYLLYSNARCMLPPPPVPTFLDSVSANVFVYLRRVRPCHCYRWILSASTNLRRSINQPPLNSTYPTIPPGRPRGVSTRRNFAGTRSRQSLWRAVFLHLHGRGVRSPNGGCQGGRRGGEGALSGRRRGIQFVG